MSYSKNYLLKIYISGNYDNCKIKAKAYTITNQIYKKDILFFFNVTKNDLNNHTNAIKYIERYLSRAPIAKYKIIDIRDNEVTFYYESLADNKERVEVTLDIETFLSVLLNTENPF